jgi:hypothetical protein
MADEAEEEPGDEKQALLARGLVWAMDVDPEACATSVRRLRAAHPEETPRQLARRLIVSRARKAAAEGFVTGLPSNPFVAAPAAVADLIYLLRVLGQLTAEVGLLADEAYFADPAWRDDALLIFGGRAAVAQALKVAAVTGVESSSKSQLKKKLTRSGFKTLRKVVLKYFGKKLTQRGLTRLVPVLGGVIGGTWNLAEVKIFGRRIVAYQFDGLLE